MRTLYCDLFIVPNAPCVVPPDSQVEPFMRRYPDFVNPPAGATIAVQVCMHSDDCANWDCHGAETAVYAVPLEMIAGKKELDTVELLLKKRIPVDMWNATEAGEATVPDQEQIRVVATLNQASGRYSRLGTFENVLHTLIHIPNYFSDQWPNEAAAEREFLKIRKELLGW